MSAIKFSKQMSQPNHKEVDYWVDYNSDPYGGKIKYHNGTDWVDLVNVNGGSVNLSDYFNKSQINSMLVGKASQESVDNKADKKDVNDLIKNIEILKLEEGVNLIIFKYDDTNVAVSLPIADSTQSGIVTAEDFENFVKQHQLQSLYSEMYDKLAEIRSEYQKKLKAGRNIVIDDDNTIHSESDIIVEWDLIENKPQFHEVATSGDYNDLLNTPDNKISTLQQSLSNEVNRATAAELALSSRIDAHFDVTNILIEQKADKADTYTKDLINEKLSGVYKIQGSCTFEELPAVDNVVGDVYNITNVFTLDGIEYPMGTNIVWTESGWDALAGIFDSSELEESIDIVDQSLSQEKIRAIKAEQANADNINTERNRAISVEEQLQSNIDTLSDDVEIKYIDLQLDISYETQRATAAESVLDDKFNQYLPLTGGTLSGGLTITAGNFIMEGSDAVTKKLYPTATETYELGQSSRKWSNVHTVLLNNGTPWTSANDGAGSGLDADLLDGMQPSELSVKSATTLTAKYVHTISDVKLIYKKFASITINKRYTGYSSTLFLRTSKSSSNGYGNLCQVYVNCYQQNALGETPFYSLKTDCDDRYFSIRGIVNYTSSESTFDLYVYGRNKNYTSMSVSLLSGDDIISIGDTVLSELPSGTKVTPGKMGSVYTATKLQTPVSLWGLSFDGTADISGNITSGELVDWYGVSWSENSSSPTCTRIGNMAMHKSLPILSAMKGYIIPNIKYNLKTNDAGSYTEQIIPYDFVKGTSSFGVASNSLITGNNVVFGNIMVKIPEFWYIDDYDPATETHNLKLSQTAKAGWCHHKEAYVSAYEGYNDGTLYKSIKNVIPTVNQSRTTLRTAARANGYEGESKWNIYTYEEHRAICHLFLVEYATRNSLLEVNTELTSEGFKQGGLGLGCTTGTVTINGTTTYSFIPTGTTDSLGNGSGQVAYTVTLTDADGNETDTVTRYVNRYRGIENPFGHIWKHVDDVITQYNAETTYRTVYKCNKPEYFETNKNNKYKPLCSFPGGGGGYLKEIKATINCDFFPLTKTGGSTTTYWCDYSYDNTDVSEHCLFMGGTSGSGGGKAGLFYFSLNREVSYSYVSFGSRLTYLPWAE